MAKNYIKDVVLKEVIISIPNNPDKFILMTGNEKEIERKMENLGYELKEVLRAEIDTDVYGKYLHFKIDSNEQRLKTKIGKLYNDLNDVFEEKFPYDISFSGVGVDVRNGIKTSGSIFGYPNPFTQTQSEFINEMTKNIKN